MGISVSFLDLGLSGESFFVLHVLLDVKQWQHKNYLPLQFVFDGNMDLTFGFEAPICSGRAFLFFFPVK